MECDQILNLLEHLNISELKELVNDEDAFSNFTKDATATMKKDFDEQKQMLIASNKSLAEYNLDQEELLNTKKEQIIQLNKDINTLTQSIEAKLDIFKNHQNNANGETVLALLQTAASETEEESEKMAEQFLSGSLDTDKFLESFTPKRILMHLRRIKADKMTEMLTKRSSYSLPSPSHSIHNGPPSVFPNYPNLPGQQSQHYPNIPGNSPGQYRPGYPTPNYTPGYPIAGPNMMPNLPNLPMAQYPQISPQMPRPYF